jgi:hypothetical protein
MKDAPNPVAEIANAGAAPSSATPAEQALDQQLKTMFQTVEAAAVPTHLVRLADTLSGAAPSGDDEGLN